MSLFRRIEQRESYHPRDPALVELFGGGMRSSSGMSVTPKNALAIPAFWSGVRLVCETHAAMPLVLIRLANGKRQRAKSHPLYRVLHEEPNEHQTSMEWREMCQAHILLRGISYNAITFTQGGFVEQLVPLHPDRVTPRYEALVPGGPKQRFWRYDPPDGGPPQLFMPGELFIVPGISIFDMLRSVDPIATSRDSLGLAMAAEQHGAHHFANGVSPSGVLEHPKSLKDDAWKRLKADWDAQRAGVQNAGKTVILEEGMKWHQIGLTNKDAQYIESRKFQVTEIARILRVPPHLIYDLERATFTNIEHQGIEFVKYTMLPWLVRWEQRITKHLLGPDERKTLYPKFIAAALERGDMKSRYEAYAIGRQWGFRSVNQIMDLEDEDQIGAQGDVFLAPTNMTPADQLGKPTEPKQLPASTDPEDDDEDEDEDKRMLQVRQRVVVAQTRVFLDAAQRVLGKEQKAAQRAIAQARAQKTAAPLEKWLESYDADHEALVYRTFLPAVNTLAETIHTLTPDAALPDCDALARAIARRHVAKQRAEARAALAGSCEERCTALESLAKGWDTRAPELAGGEVESISASVMRQLPALTPAA